MSEMIVIRIELLLRIAKEFPNNMFDPKAVTEMITGKLAFSCFTSQFKAFSQVFRLFQ